MVHFLREKNSKSESNSEIYKFRSSLFESSALKKCYVEFVKFIYINIYNENEIIEWFIIVQNILSNSNI